MVNYHGLGVLSTTQINDDDDDDEVEEEEHPPIIPSRPGKSNMNDMSRPGVSKAPISKRVLDSNGMNDMSRPGVSKAPISKRVLDSNGICMIYY
jgi:hypothetical protein